MKEITAIYYRGGVDCPDVEVECEPIDDPIATTAANPTTEPSGTGSGTTKTPLETTTSPSKTHASNVTATPSMKTNGTTPTGTKNTDASDGALLGGLGLVFFLGSLLFI